MCYFKDVTYVHVLKFKGYERICFKNRSHISVEMYLGEKLAFKMIFFLISEFLNSCWLCEVCRVYNWKKKKAPSKEKVTQNLSDQIRSVAQLCPTLWDPMNRSMPGLPVHHQLPEFTETHSVMPCTISSSVVPFSSCPQSLPASGSFPMNQLFAWGGQSTRVSALASFLPKKSQGWSPSEWTGWTVQKRSLWPR